MDENVIAFPSPENAKQGFVEMNRLQLAVENLFAQTGDTKRELHTRESISAVQQETQQIAEKISAAIADIDGLRPNMPSAKEFAELAWQILTIPLQYGEGRAAMSYYGTNQELQNVIDLYKNKLAQLQQSGLERL